MSQLVLKTEFNGDVRRIPIPVNISFVELYQKIQKIYGFTSNFIFKYLDDENDLITIGSEEELEEAVRISVAKKFFAYSLMILHYQNHLQKYQKNHQNLLR